MRKIFSLLFGFIRQKVRQSKAQNLTKLVKKRLCKNPENS